MGPGHRGHQGEAEPRPLAPVDEGLQDPGKEVLGEPGARVHEPDPDPFPFPGKLRPHGKPAVAAGVLQNVLHREGQKLGVGQDPPLPLDPRPRVLASRQLLPNGLPHPTTAFVNPTDPRHPFLWLRLRPRYRPIRWALFTSVLLHRSLVEEHGLPHKAFFIWEDDLEYTARALRRGLGLQVRDSEVIHKSASKPYISATTGENRLFYGVRNRIWVLRSPAFGPLGKAFLALQLLFGLLTYLAFHPSRKSLQEIGRALRAGLTTSPC